ncbi:MAG: glycoside hydrolase family 2 protein [Verrucomicrobiota bacterium]
MSILLAAAILPARAEPAAAADWRSLSSGPWRLQNELSVSTPGRDIARPGFNDRDWVPAVVPGTVLGSYVARGLVPDPWFGDQMSRISDDFFSRRDFWYRREFVVPPEVAGRRLWLNFDGVNWKADVFLNGRALGRIDGAFIRGRFDISGLVQPGATNALAVLIHHVAHPDPGPRKITQKTLGARTTNGDVLGRDSPTFLASAGWNWLPIVRGREIGIWNDVRLEDSGEVTLADPWVIADFSPADPAHADLRLMTSVSNAAARRVTALLRGSVAGASFSAPIALEPGEMRNVALTPSNCPALRLSHPQLWWPNGYGPQPLYTLDLDCETGAAVSDRKSVTFGVRRIDYAVTNGSLVLSVNGCPILCRGGNWGMDEGMLNCDAAGYDIRVRLHRDAGLNMIRNWVGMVGRREFYEACDRYGILVWDDFWLANPVDGPEPDDPGMFLSNARDKIRRVRSHPSLALYCGRNEGDPPPELNEALQAAVAELDGTRLYLSNSAAGIVTGRGPYEVKDVEWYFENRGRTFHSELGIVAVPVVESMRAMMPESDLWPINDMWAVHDYQSPRMPQYTERIGRRYDPPSGIEDYCRKAQMVNLESAKAMFESLRAGRGGGTLLWMTQPAWPSLICQIYDYWFEPTAAYFGVRKACEPVHVFWNAATDRVQAANDSTTNLSGLSVEAWRYDLSGRPVWHRTAALDLPAGAVRDCFDFERAPDPGRVFLVKLALRRGSEVLSDNFYWGSGRGASCRELNDLPAVRLNAVVRRVEPAVPGRYRVLLTNSTNAPALAIRLKVSRDGARVLPVFYDDNYFSLLPGEQREVQLEYNAAMGAATNAARLGVEGWNVAPSEMVIP